MLPQQLSASELGAAFDAAWADAQSQQLTTGTRASLRAVLYKLNARRVTLHQCNKVTCHCVACIADTTKAYKMLYYVFSLLC
jgi:hypothetical protein